MKSERKRNIAFGATNGQIRRIKVRDRGQGPSQKIGIHPLMCVGSNENDCSSSDKGSINGTQRKLNRITKQLKCKVTTIAVRAAGS